jgi:hypothetical protein
LPRIEPLQEGAGHRSPSSSGSMKVTRRLFPSSMSPSRS